MDEDTIGMDEVMAVFSVTDALGLHRERVSIPLEKADPGAVRRLPTGEVEVVVPRSVPLQAWLPTLRRELLALGFAPAEEDEEG